MILSEVDAAKFLLLCVVATAAIVSLRANPHFHSHPLLLLSALIWMAGQSANMGWFYQAIERLRPALIADLSAGLISSAAILALVKRPEDGWKVLLLQGCASLGTAAFAFCWALVGSGVVRPAWSGIVARLRSGRHVFGFRFALGIYSFGNPFILGWLASATAVGHYSGAEKIARALPSDGIPARAGGVSSREPSCVTGQREGEPNRRYCADRRGRRPGCSAASRP